MLEAKRKVLRAVRGRERIHGYALANLLGLNTSTIYQHLRELEDEGYVHSEFVGRRRIFRVTKKGDLMLQALGDSEERPT